MERRLLPLIIFLFLAVRGLSQIHVDNISIARDTFGVPHIFASTDAKVAYGLAWAHAEDDFENIQLMMITASGRLAEIKGKASAPSDYFVKFIRAKEQVEAMYEKDLSPAYRKVLQGYVDGLNAYALSHQKEIKLKGIFPVTPQNVITAYVIILTNMVGVSRALEFVVKGKPDDYIFNANAGSNAVAMNSAITADSSTYLMINPHVPIEGPASWYEAHLHSDEGMNIYGALVPGMIVPAMGCNDHLGWAITFNWPDYVDIYEMELNPENKNQYKFDGEWKNFEVSKIPLKVKVGTGKITVKRQALWCVYGPAYRTEKGVYALRYNTMFNVKAAEQWYKMSKAKEYSQFYEAMEIQGIPLFNFMMADDKDNIFYLFNAGLPKRDNAFNWQKTVPGNTSKTLWNSFYGIGQLPLKYNPKCGYLYNTNNTPFHCTANAENPMESSYDKQSAFSWNRVNNRDLRFNEIIVSKSRINFEEFKKIKYDCQYPSKTGGIYTIFKPVLDLDETQYPELADAIIKLKKWNFCGEIDNREAALVTVTFNDLFIRKGAAYNELETGFSYTTDELIASIKIAKAFMLKHYKTLDIPFGDVQKIVRGDKSFSASGFPECLQAMASKTDGSGILKAVNGDSFIMFAKFSPKGNTYEAVVPFGASRKKNDPHSTDQMELYSKHKTKPVSLDKNKVLKEAVRVYHPQ
ncbi:MAG: peptidase penicillin amidase [Bacteroidota bacterium]|jgi:acyl-homoserine-lactone acylase|nr:peptidase penicillin amidase [Bacteroidota bacterium]